LSFLRTVNAIQTNLDLFVGFIQNGDDITVGDLAWKSVALAKWADQTKGKTRQTGKPRFFINPFRET